MILRFFLLGLLTLTAWAAPPELTVSAQDASHQLDEQIRAFTAAVERVRELGTKAPPPGGPYMDFALSDLKEANLEIMSRSLFRTGTMHLSVPKSEMDQWNRELKAVYAHLKECQGQLEREIDLMRRQSAIDAKVQLLAKGSEDIQARQQRGKLTREQMLVELEALLRPLPKLRKQRADLELLRKQMLEEYQRRPLLAEIPSAFTGGNQVTPLIDGQRVYARVAELLDGVAARGKGKGYVHIGVWKLNHLTRLVDVGPTLGERLKAVAAAGNEVRISLYSSSTAPGEVKNTNPAALAALHQQGNIFVQLQDHPSFVGSWHEKEFIFYDGSEVTAIVGGLNFGHEYHDAAPHLENNHWHDVAVELRGPATVAVEADFIQRWYEHGGTVADVAGPSPAVPQAVDARVKICLTRPEGKLSLGPFTQDANEQFFSPKSLIQELLGWIQQAQEYVYIENFAVTNPLIVGALAQRISELRVQGKSLKVIIVVPDLGKREVYGWLHRNTWSRLSHARCDEFQYLEDGKKKTVVRARDGRARWVYRIAGQWLEESRVEWDTGSCPASAIVSFTPQQPLYKLFADPKQSFGGAFVYTHGKVCLVDDRFALIGSANFNVRSMAYDGEIGAFFLGKPAADFRRQLWSEYWQGSPPDPVDWEKRAEEMSDSPNRKVPGLYVLPISQREFLGTAPPEFNWTEREYWAAHTLY